MAKSTITYKLKFKWYAHPVAFVLWMCGAKEWVKPWMWKIEGAKPK